ncbi:hypothetical protein [Nocardia vinacea]|uniref:hypothetical protein n=1 Tax=Nocardia vinacea TaxID=96468 RepID=UPI00031DDD7F|nr:hypothetical protein [Nocardia vinacea]
MASTTPSATIRNQLARLLLRGSSVEPPVSTLSGGERFRVSSVRGALWSGSSGRG